MKSLVEGLPPEIAQQISAEWHKNEAEYWAKRQELLSRYEGQWIGFAGGKVVASGSSPVEVLHAARESTSHPFLTCVGHEDEPCRVRRAVFQYDTSYPGEPMPVIAAEFRKHQHSSGMTMGTVIPDTGADATVLPWADCQQLHLDPSDSCSGTHRRHSRKFRCNNCLSGLSAPRRTYISLPASCRFSGF